MKARETTALGSFFQQLIIHVLKMCVYLLIWICLAWYKYLYSSSKQGDLWYAQFFLTGVHIFSRIKVAFGTPSSGCRSTSLACAGRGTASRAGLSLGSQRTGRVHWSRRHRQTPTTSAFTVITRDRVFLMRKAKAKWGEKSLKSMSTAQNKLHCFPASPLLVSRTLRFAVLLRGTPSNPRKDRSSTRGV